VEKTRLDRQVVLKAALRLLDETGLDGLSLRRLAQELGVQAPALYWHFRSKRELLDHLADVIAQESQPRSRPAAGQTWDQWLLERAHAQRRALLAHRDSVRAMAGNRPTETSLAAIEEILDVLCAAGFTPGQALRSLMTLSAYVGGFVLEEQAERSREAEEFLGGLDAGAPLMVKALREVGDPSGDAGFGHGVRLIIDGMRAVLSQAQPA
jgi:TetR/AcrR family transcriptional regulator, tetracycline repressor protein